MRKICLPIAAACMLNFAFPAATKAATEGNSTTAKAPAQTEQETADMLTDRLYELYGMNKTELSYSEKKELRTEVRTIKNQLQGLDKRVSISIGAIIIIVLLLIIIF